MIAAKTFHELWLEHRAALERWLATEQSSADSHTAYADAAAIGRRIYETVLLALYNPSAVRHPHKLPFAYDGRFCLIHDDGELEDWMLQVYGIHGGAPVAQSREVPSASVDAAGGDGPDVEGEKTVASGSSDPQTAGANASLPVGSF